MAAKTMRSKVLISGQRLTVKSVIGGWWLVASTRFAAFLCALVLCTLFPVTCPLSYAQTTNAAINGQITDPQGKIVPGVDVKAINVDTNAVFPSKSNGSGIYVLPSLPPGQYRLVVRKEGFKEINKIGLVLHVQDTLEQNFVLELGPVGTSVTVEAGGLNINTTDASVSTVVTRELVSTLPLNGRSFNTLLELTPGVVIVPSNFGTALGQFSINGQRDDANYFSVDGVSANFGIFNGGTESVGGNTPAFNAFGGTSSMASVDAVQEFRVQTSSFAPEFGRTPGGQVEITTRSGTNQFHGNVFDCFRNTVLDANDWFLNAAGQPRAPDHQNDFGGTLGGPIIRDRTFFFFSYEGLRLDQPQATKVNVPSVAARTSASSSAVQAILNAYPVPNGTPSSNPLISTFTGGYANRLTSNVAALRIDHKINQRIAIFGRYNYAPSEIIDRFGALSSEVSHSDRNHWVNHCFNA